MMAERTVRVYDLETEQLSTIPARELAPGMVQAKVPGIDGHVWIDASKVEEGSQEPPCHPPLSAEIRELVREIQEVFHDVRPMTLEQWEDGFRRDIHTCQEIKIWLRLAKAYTHFTAGRELSPEQKRDIFDVIVACSHGGNSNAPLVTTPVTLSKKRVRQIAEFCESQTGKLLAEDLKRRPGCIAALIRQDAEDCRVRDQFLKEQWQNAKTPEDRRRVLDCCRIWGVASDFLGAT